MMRLAAACALTLLAACNRNTDAGADREAESEIGVSEWIDPDTGDPAEDNIPRLEDH